MSDQLLALLLLFAGSSATSYVTTRIVKEFAERIGAGDLPSDRKIHRIGTPRLGGVAIIIGFGFPLMLLAGNSHAQDLLSKSLTYLFGVLASGVLIVGLGVYDDLLGADAPRKFAVQALAAIILVSFGYHFSFVTVAGHTLELGILAVLASIVWIIGVINAVNFLDGMDALATLIAITISVTFGVIALIRHDIFSLVIMTALTGSLCGFLPWNRPPAKIFMGDSGSLFIGLLLAACSIARPSKAPTALLIGGPILALGVPVLDTLIVMRQRFAARDEPLSRRINSMFNADRRHLHHILVARYGSWTKVVASIWGVTMLFAVAAVLTVMPATKIIGYSIGLVALLALLLLRYRPARRRYRVSATPEA